MFVVAFVAGGIWCLIAALLKSKWGVSETLVTLMLNYIATQLVAFCIIRRQKEDMTDRERHIVALTLAIVTAPWTFFIPVY